MEQVHQRGRHVCSAGRCCAPSCGRKPSARREGGKEEDDDDDRDHDVDREQQGGRTRKERDRGCGREPPKGKSKGGFGEARGGRGAWGRRVSDPTSSRNLRERDEVGGRSSTGNAHRPRRGPDRPGHRAGCPTTSSGRWGGKSLDEVTAATRRRDAWNGVSSTGRLLLDGPAGVGAHRAGWRGGGRGRRRSLFGALDAAGGTCLAQEPSSAREEPLETRSRDAVDRWPSSGTPWDGRTLPARTDFVTVCATNG